MDYRIPRALREQIIGLYQSGANVTTIGKRLGITRRTVYRWIKRYEEEDNLENHPPLPRNKKELPTPQAEIIEADQYKRTYFGPDIPTLELECWEEELSEYQLKAYKVADEEYKSIQNKLDEIVKETGGEIVYNGDQFTAYQLLGKQPVLKDLERQSADIIRSRSRSISTTKDSKSDRKRGRPRKARDEDRDYSPSPSVSPEPRSKKRSRKDKEEKRKDGKTKDKTITPSNVHSVVTNVRPSEATAIGGLSTGSATKATAIVDLTKDDSNKNVADSREVSFNKLQGKTFPSLVVVARPYLRSKEVPPPSDRSTLDSKVKSVLMHTPTKFTEWLIQQGLVRSEQFCTIHHANKLKLGMYSDVSKFPYSGGYVWISECCPTRFVSVFYSSIFEGAAHPPSVLLKLIYHWACQTNVQNVVQWVKVDNLYVKGLFTWLRAACTSAIHQHLGWLGGAGKKVEVGVISLGTTSHDGTQRQVKVEVLGVLDPVAKLIRLRAVEPLAEHEKHYKKRFQKILEPLSQWVHPSSTILTDLTVDKGTLIGMGFKTVHQTSAHADQPSKNSNANIMEYLRRIVPRMFQNTLSLLSRQIIQQFLDELVWREKFGVSPGLAFENIVVHIAEQTKMESKEVITARLNKIASNPFKNWKYTKKTKGTDEKDGDTGRSKRSRKKRSDSPSPTPSKKSDKKKKLIYIDDDDDDEDEEVPLSVNKKIKQEKVDKSKDTKDRKRNKRERSTYVIDDDLDDVPLKSIKKEVKPEETVAMERFYFGQFGGSGEARRIAIAVECPTCNVELTNNCELMRHLYRHAIPTPENMGEDGGVQCIYCLIKFVNDDELHLHLKHLHPNDTKSPDLFTYACLICEVRFPAVLTLANHMQRTHTPLELPYVCGQCDYRASSHRAAIDHYYTKHGHDNGVLCPHCLRVIFVYSDGEDLSSNVRVFMDHLALHNNKEMEIKCNRCMLRFVHLGTMKEHQIRDHCTVQNATPLCNEEHLITKPKTKPRPPVKDSTSHVIDETYENTTVMVPDGMLCRECDTHLDAEKHFLGRAVCSKCPYVTSCYRAMLQHSGFCAGPHSLEDAPRDAPASTHCVCGYTTNIGTDMLTHLLECDHKTSYQSEEVAQANIVRQEEAKAIEDLAKPLEDSIEEDKPVEETEKMIDEPEKTIDEPMDTAVDSSIADFAPPSVLNTQLSLDDLAPPSVLQQDQQDPEHLKAAYDQPLATPRQIEPYTLGDFEPLPQEPLPQPDFEQL